MGAVIYLSDTQVESLTQAIKNELDKMIGLTVEEAHIRYGMDLLNIRESLETIQTREKEKSHAISGNQMQSY